MLEPASPNVASTDNFFPADCPWVDHGDYVCLLASRCRSCGATAFPPKDACHACGSGDLERFELSAEGVIYTFSEIHTAPPMFETPYVVGYVDFPEGVRVFGQIDAPAADVAIDQKVRARISVVRRDQKGNPVRSFKFGSGSE